MKSQTRSRVSVAILVAIVVGLLNQGQASAAMSVSKPRDPRPKVTKGTTWPAPSKVILLSMGDGRLRVAWKSVQGASNYRVIIRSVQSDGKRNYYPVVQQSVTPGYPYGSTGGRLLYSSKVPASDNRAVSQRLTYLVTVQVIQGRTYGNFAADMEHNVLTPRAHLWCSATLGILTTTRDSTRSILGVLPGVALPAGYAVDAVSFATSGQSLADFLRSKGENVVVDFAATVVPAGRAKEVVKGAATVRSIKQMIDQGRKNAAEIDRTCVY